METPPINRYPVQTYVIEYNELLIREAIIKEIARGGQVFILYNKIKNMDALIRQYEQIIPEASIRYAHGQMNKEKIQEIMGDFYENKLMIRLNTTKKEEKKEKLDKENGTKENKDGTIEYVKDENDNQEYSIANSPILQKMCKEFAIDEILVFNDDGHTVAANDDLWYFALSTNKKDQSYPFRNVLEAKERTYVQEAQENEQGVLSQQMH